MAELAERDFGGAPVSDDESARVFSAFGCRGRTSSPAGSGTPSWAHGMKLLRELDVVAELARIDCPTLVCVDELDPVTPVAAARELFAALPAGLATLEEIEGAGHFSWKDAPDRY